MFQDFTEKGKIHIRLQKSGHRSITLIEGLDLDLDLHRIAKAMKKHFNCASSIQKDLHDNDVIQLQGDQRENVKEWLVVQEILTDKEVKDRLVVHGG